MDDDVLLRSLTAAFEPDPLYRWLYPDPRTRPTALRANLELSLARTRQVGEVDADTSGHAAALWTAPGVELLVDPAPFVELLGRWAPGRLDDALAGMAACSRFTDPHDQVLHVLGVHPDHQGRGAAARLLEPRLLQLDRERIPAYLESSNERNLGFYRRCGFEVLGEVALAPGGPVMRPMRRRPRRRAHASSSNSS